MAISYPITLPSSPGYKTAEIIAQSATAVRASPFTFSQQVQAHQGGMWRMTVDIPPMTRAEAEPWLAAMISLRGQYGTFYLKAPGGGTAQGVATGTPVVDGASQSGLTLAVRGFTNSTTDILKAGDWIEVDAYLYKVMADADSDGAGDVTLDIWPRLRTSPSDGAIVTVSDAKGTFRLAKNQQSYSINTALHYGLQIQAVEAI